MVIVPVLQKVRQISTHVINATARKKKKHSYAGVQWVQILVYFACLIISNDFMINLVVQFIPPERSEVSGQ